MLIVLLGAFAAACNIIYPLPQLVRLWRTGDVAGVSPATVVASAVGASWWTAYALSIGDVPAIAACVFGMLAHLSVLGALTRGGGLDLRHWLPIALPLVALSGLAWWSPALVGVMANCCSAIRALPQLWTALRARTSLSGCSLSTWVLTAASGTSWLAYGFLTGHPLLGLAYLVTVPAALIICWRLVRARPPVLIRPGTPRASKALHEEEVPSPEPGELHVAAA